MLVYLDTMIVQYCADYEDFIFENDGRNPASQRALAKELDSLRQLVELEQFGNWAFAAPIHLMRELLAGKPSVNQRKVYAVLMDSWNDSGWNDCYERNEGSISTIDQSLRALNLKHAADRRHLAEAIALSASWFITNDKDILRKTRDKNQKMGEVHLLRVAKPSECVKEISVGLILH